jgi:hypothetical protein
MKMITNDQIRQELINHLVTEIKNATRLELILHNNGETDLPDEETVMPGSAVKTKTIDPDNVFYAVRSSEAKTLPATRVTATMDGGIHYICDTFDASVLYNKLYITVAIANTGSSIAYDQLTLQAIGINLNGVAEDVLLAVGNNSRGSIPSGYTREFNFLIALDGSGN